MRVCHVCSAHPADDGRVFHRACVSLATVGYDVHLLAVGEGREEYMRSGVTVHPLPRCTRRSERFARGARVARQAAALEPDLFHVHEPELLRAVLQRAGARPVVYDVHESHLDVLTDSEWLPRPLRPLACMLWDRNERQLVPRCAGIITVNEEIARRYRPMHPRVRIVHNFPELAVDNFPPPDRDGKTCVFAGALAPIRGLSQILEALALLKKRGLDVPLDLAAIPPDDDYVRSLMAEAERLGIAGQVRYHGSLSKGEAIALQRRASIGLVPYLPTRNNVLGLPNKLVECMALGLPVVFSDFPMYREIAGNSGAGIAVDPTKPEQIADAIERLARNPELAREMSEAGRRAIRERFNWRVEQQRLLSLYEEILGAPGAREPAAGQEAVHA
jgi:glycosyltransferase involved in cell wall biosynthesis